MRYVIRRLATECWLDECEFFCDKRLGEKDVEDVVVDRMASGELRLVGTAVLCLVLRKNDGREERVGKDVVVGRNGLIVSGD